MHLFKAFGIFTLVWLMAASLSQAEMSISISNLKDGDIVTSCVDFDVLLDVNSDGKTISDVRLYSNGGLKGRIRNEPWQYTWKNIAGGVYTVQAQLRADDDTEAWSEPIILRAGNVSRGEKAYNGNFDCGTTLAPWTMNINTSGGAAATAEVIEESYFDDIGYLFIEITNAGSEFWHIQLQQNIPVDSGHVYTLTFLADADDQKSINISMQENQDPWGVQFSQDLVIDGADEYGPYEFDCQHTDPTNYIRFNISGNTIPIYLDNIRVIDQSMSSVKSTEFSFGGVVKEYELFAAYPNPFNMNTTIPIHLSKAENIDLSIYNIHGQRVKTLVHGYQNAGDSRLTWDGTDDQHNILPSGVYFYNLAIDKHDVQLTRKIIMVK